MSDARIEAFLADVLALEGENQDAIREGVHIALANCEQIFKAHEVNRRMKDPMPRSRGRGNPTSQGNAKRRASKVCVERY